MALAPAVPEGEVGALAATAHLVGGCFVVGGDSLLCL